MPRNIGRLCTYCRDRVSTPCETQSNADRCWKYIKKQATRFKRIFKSLFKLY